MSIRLETLDLIPSIEQEPKSLLRNKGKHPTQGSFSYPDFLVVMGEVVVFPVM